MGLPAHWTSPIYGECLTAHAAAAYLRERGQDCVVASGTLVIADDPELSLIPVDTPMGRMFPVSQLDVILAPRQPLPQDSKTDYNPDEQDQLNI